MTSWRERLAAIAEPLAVALLGLAAGWPLLRALPTRSIDGPLHLYRLVELERCLRAGVLFPRWLPDLAQGYGFPLFNYYPPLPYYVAEVWRLFGATFARALNLTFLLGILLSGATMYLLAKDWSNRGGGVLAALLYMYAPYTLFDVLARGGLAEVWAWALAPLVLWAFRRLVTRAERRWLPLAALSLAAVALTHHLSLLTFAPLLILLIIGSALQVRSWRGLGLAVAAGALAVGLSAFFTLPALLEQRYIHIENVFSGTGFDYHNFFVSWRTLLAGPRTVDATLMSAGSVYAVGWLQIGIGLAGALATLLLRRDRGRAWGWYLGGLVIAAVCFFMMLAPAARAWELIPPLRFLQFPWRFLAPLTLLLAWLASGVARVWPEGHAWQRANRAGLAVLLLALCLYATPQLYAQPLPLRSANPTLGDLADFEHHSYELGLTSAGDYMPRWVPETTWGSPMVAQYQAGQPVTWLAADRMPAGVQVQRASYGVNDMRLALASSAPFQAIVNQYYFPGWTAYVDGQRATAGPTAQGLIAVDVPAGSHELRLRFEETPLRLAADGVSLLSLLLFAGVTVLAYRRQGTRRQPQPSLAPAPVRAWLVLLAVLAGYVGLKLLLFDRRDTPLKVARLRGNQVQGMQHAAWADYGHELAMLGYDLPGASVPSGGSIDVNLYWRALRRMDTAYSVSLQLVDAQGRIWGQQDSWQPGEFPTFRWETDVYALDRHALPVLPGTPPGEYRVVVGVYTRDGHRPVDVYDGNGAPAGVATVLGQVQVTRATEPPALASLGMASTVRAAVNDEIELLGYNLPTEPLRPGQRLRFTLFWGANAAPRSDYRAVALLGTALQEVTTYNSWPAASAAFPTTAWRAGEVVRAQYDLLIPPDTAAGVTPLRVALAGAGGLLGKTIEIGQVQVQAIEHRMDVPPMQQHTGAMLGEALTLLGYDVEPAQTARGGTVHLRLYWQARAEMRTEYTVFTHLLDGENHITAQQDSVPQQGARPTTSWVTGEVLADDYSLTVRQDAPLGQQRIEVGVYDPVSGQRLPVADAQGKPLGDALILGTVEVR